MCLLGGSGGMPPQEDFEFFRLQSGTRLSFNTCDKTIITTLNFKISGWGIMAGGGKFHTPPPYETLVTVTHYH